MVFITDLEDSPTHDVFINHRGVDTRHSIAELLYSKLHQQGIRTFIDDELIRGAEVTSTLLKAIERSKISIIIFSENYASSEWCLDELVRILQCKKSKEQVVRTIFYHVQPSDVGNQKGSFGEAFAYHESKYKNNMEKVQKWRNALAEAADLSGWPFLDGYEAKFVHHIVEDISVQVLKRPYLNVGNYLVGMETRVREVNELLGHGLNDTRMVGICGIGGIGKTTIAKAVYNSIAHRFEKCCFLENVRENSLEQRGLLQLQKTLLFQILGKNISVTDVNRGTNLIRTKLRSIRVLLIIDDVDQLDQLVKLGGRSDSFGPGSRIIITTRDRTILAAHEVDVIYEIKGLDSEESFELFSSNAFPNSRVPNNYVEFASTIVEYTQGSPLGLTALGSSLRGKSTDQWQIVSDICKRAPNVDIQEILEITCNEPNHPQNAPTDIEANHVRTLEALEQSAHQDSQIFCSKRVSKVFSAEWTFLLTALCLEFLSLAFDQAASPRKPQYALVGMLLAIGALLISISELVLKGMQQRVKLKRCRMLWWFYHERPRCGAFGSLPEIYGLIGGISQSACSIIQYVCFIRHAENPIKVSLWPAIFLVCLGVSRLNKGDDS